jgi:uncharacterized membrane protein required for colicin V production
MIEFLKRLNWIDILVLILLVRVVYISAKTGFVIEFMKMLGVLFSCFFAFHFYTKLASYLASCTNMAQASLEVVSFLVIWLVVFWLCQLARNGLFVVFTVQTLSLVDRWGAAVVSLIRFFLTASMVLYVFLASGYAYMEKMTVSSFSQKYVLKVAPTVYFKTVNGFVVKFFPEQKVNPAVTDELGKVSR